MAPSDDIDRLMAIMTAAFDPLHGEAWTRKQVEDALVVGNCHYFLATEHRTDAGPGEGAAGFSLSRTGYDEEELLLFAVAPQYRGRGIGKFILDKLLSCARARGAKRLLLEMRCDNPAKSLYLDFGFSPIGKRPDYYRRADGKRTDAITFALQIN